jgi:hypothetical protein
VISLFAGKKQGKTGFAAVVRIAKPLLFLRGAGQIP